MIVKELIEKLQEFSLEAPVRVAKEFTNKDYPIVKVRLEAGEVFIEHLDDEYEDEEE